MRNAIIAVVILATCGLSVPGASALGDEPPSLDPLVGAILPESMQVHPESARLAGRTRHPVTGAQWALRTTRSRMGRTCLEVGPVLDDDIAIRGADGTLQKRPFVPAACSEPVEESPYYADIVLARNGRSSTLFGVVDPAVRRLTIADGDAVREVPLTPDRGFIAIFDGGDLADHPVTLTLEDGRRVTYDGQPGNPIPKKPGR